jgi:hypothetical protein
MHEDTTYLQMYLWKFKVPLKIMIFMWLLHKKILLTKDNLLKRNWIVVCKKRAFCEFKGVG